MRRWLWLAIAAAPVLACFQELDSRSASGAGDKPATTNSAPAPIDLATPAIDLPDGGSTGDSCVALATSAHAVLGKYCGSCHAPPAKMGGFDAVLDDGRLVVAVSSTAVDDAGKPQRLVIPGAPTDSRLYAMVADGQMPPAVAPPLPAPSPSELSVIRAWITSCLGAP